MTVNEGRMTVTLPDIFPPMEQESHVLSFKVAGVLTEVLVSVTRHHRATGEALQVALAHSLPSSILLSRSEHQGPCLLESLHSIATYFVLNLIPQVLKIIKLNTLIKILLT